MKPITNHSSCEELLCTEEQLVVQHFAQGQRTNPISNFIDLAGSNNFVPVPSEEKKKCQYFWALHVLAHSRGAPATHRVMSPELHEAPSGNGLCEVSVCMKRFSK